MRSSLAIPFRVKYKFYMFYSENIQKFHKFWKVKTTCSLHTNHFSKLKNVRFLTWKRFNKKSRICVCIFHYLFLFCHKNYYSSDTYISVKLAHRTELVDICNMLQCYGIEINATQNHLFYVICLGFVLFYRDCRSHKI